MPWSYSQSSGKMTLNGKLVGTGYSGKGEGMNNPAMQDKARVGPLPQGTYTIGPAFKHPEKGPIVMRLRPQRGTQMFGRSGFLIHGDNKAMNHSASNGCIILGPDIRKQISASDDRNLIVTP